MGKNDLQTAQSDWAKRIDKYISAGIPQSVWEPIASADMKKVYTNASSPMTNENADTEVYAAWKGSNPIPESPRHRSGLFGTLDTIASNIVPDIGNIITDLPRGLYDLGKNVVSPKQWENTGHDLSQALTDAGKGSYGQALRDATQSPLLSLIPGLADAADLTTTKGRQQLEEHPVTAALDVLSLARPLAAASGVALAGSGGSEALTAALDEASTMGKLRGRVDVRKEDPSALAALVSGRPIQAATRGLDRAITAHTGGLQTDLDTGQELGRGQVLSRRALDKVKLDSKNRALSTALNRKQIAGEAIFKDFNTKTLDDIFAPFGNDSQTVAKITAFTEKAAMGDTASMTPQELTVYDKIVQLRATLEDRYTSSGDLIRLQEGLYPHDSPVVKAHNLRSRRAASVEKTADKVAKAQSRHNQAQIALSKAQQVARTAPKENTRELIAAKDGLARAQKSLAIAKKRQATALRFHQVFPTSMGFLRKFKDSQMATYQAQVRLSRAEQRYAKTHAATGPNPIIRGNLQAAAQEAKTAENELSKLSLKHKSNLSRLKKADEIFQRKLIRNPPAHLHEWVRNNFRDRVAKAYEGKQLNENNIPVSRVHELYQLSTFSNAIKEIRNSPTLDRLETYVGKEELNKLWESTVSEGLKLSQYGISPMYFHQVRDADIKSVLSLHIGKTKDVAEAQVRKKAFNLQSSVNNIRAGLSREMLNVIQRDMMQEVYDTALAPHQRTLSELEPIYSKAALKSVGKKTGVRLDHETMTLLEAEWTKFDFDSYGIQRPGTISHTDDIYIPKSLADNLESFSTGGAGVVNFLSHSRAYNRVMGVFRTSVLYGPRHFAHVVIGGLMPIGLDSPSSLVYFPKAYSALHALSSGKPLTAVASSLARDMGTTPEAMTDILRTAGLRFDYRTDAAFKHLQTKQGQKYAQLLTDYWGKTGKRVGDGLSHVEDFAGSLYQLSVALNDIRKGANPYTALEHMRKMVVNLDGFSPFERTILKQIFPFYSFTRFATKFLVQLPFDHPLRVSILSQLSNQAREEWGTGLPQSMMSLFFIGTPGGNGEQWSVNLRNANPFRSVASMFTMAGFMESLNPILQAPFVAAGYNPLNGSAQLYPQVVYDAATGSLVAARPKGDVMLAAEQFIPELGGIDALVGVSDNLRSLQASEPDAFTRELENMFNIPFAVSKYNIPQTRGRTAVNALKGAQNALTAYKKGGDYQDTIGRYALIPYQGYLISPAAFRSYWEAETAALKSQHPGINPAALISKPPTGVATNTLQQLINIYGGSA